MKIATHNRLAHYQVEFQELQEQTAMLNTQLPGLLSQIQQMQAYLTANGGDRRARHQFAELNRRYNSVCSSIRRNTVRMQTLQRQIQAECARAMYPRGSAQRAAYTRPRNMW